MCGKQNAPKLYSLYFLLLVTYMCAQSLQLCLTLCYLMDSSPPDSSVHGILQQECWNGLLLPPPENLLHLEIEPTSPALPSLQANSLPLSMYYIQIYIYIYMYIIDFTYMFKFYIFIIIFAYQYTLNLFLLLRFVSQWNNANSD